MTLAKNTKESDVVLNFRMNGEVAYSKTIKQINNDMKLAALEYKNQISSMDKNASATEKLGAAKQKLEKQLDIMTAKTEGLRGEYTKSVQETGQYSEKSQKLYEMLLKSETSQNNLRKALEKTNEAIDAQGDKSLTTAQKLKKIEEAGEKIKGIGGKLSVGVTAPLVGIAATGAKVANDLSTSQTQIQAAFGLTEKEAENLNKTVEKVFESGMVDSVDSAKESVIGLINQLPQLKLMSTDALTDIITQAQSLEQLFGSDYEETLRGVNALMSAFGLTANEAMDYITVASQNGLDKTHELGDNLAEYAIQFAQNGYSAKQMFETLNAGLNGGAYNLDKVNDVLKEMGIRLSDGTIETAVKNLGGEWESMYASMKKSGASNEQIFQALATKISEVGDETQKATLVSTIFGSLGEDNAVQVIESMTDLSQEMTGVKGSYDEVTGAADKMNKKNQEAVTYQSAMNNLMLAASDIGEVFAPYINQIALAIKEFADWFRSLDDETKNWIVTIGMIAAAVGPVLVVLGTLMGSVAKIINGIRAVQAVWTGLTTLLAANPFVLVIAGIALLIAALVMAYKKFEWFRNGVNGTLNFIKDVFVGTFNAIGGIVKTSINWLIGMINKFIGLANRIKIPKGIPIVGGKGINIAKIPYLATGGHVLNGQAIVGEAGPELLSVNRGKTTVTPLSDEEKRNGISGKVKGNTTVQQHITIGNVDANNPSELDKLNRKFAKAAKMASAFS